MIQTKLYIADRVVKVNHLYPELQDCCKEYVTDAKKIDCEVDITQNSIDYEKDISIRVAELEGRETPNYSDGVHEIAAANRLIAKKLMEYDTLLMHGVAIAVDHRAYIFTAKSGVGKTTHISFWKEMLKERAVIINGDKPFIRLTDEGARVYGSPWCGKEGFNTNCSEALDSICILKRGEENSIREIGFHEAFPILMSQIYRTHEQSDNINTIKLIERLGNMIKFYELYCRPDLEAAKLAYETMRVKL